MNYSPQFQPRQQPKRRRPWGIWLLIIILMLIGGGAAYYLHQHTLATQKAAERQAQRQIKAKRVPTPAQPALKRPNHLSAADRRVDQQLTQTIVRNKKLDRYIASTKFNGSALVIREGRIILNKGYGLANRKTHQPDTPMTQYYIASTQKALIATAILQLQQRHLLNVHDPVAKYYPGFPNGQKIKLTNLLHHTSGLKGHAETNRKITPDQLIKSIEKAGIVSQPGQWHYLDSNYTVLAALVQKLTHQPLATYLEQHIFKPAGIKSSGYYQTFKQSPNHSTGYFINNGRYTTPHLPDLSQLFGVGNMYMTTGDMYRFDHALMTGKLINKTSRRKMFTKGSPIGYGMGFYVDPGAYNAHGVLNGWNVSNSMTHTGLTYVILFSNVQNNIDSFGNVTNQVYAILNQ